MGCRVRHTSPELQCVGGQTQVRRLALEFASEPGTRPLAPYDQSADRATGAVSNRRDQLHKAVQPFLPPQATDRNQGEFA